MNPFGLTVSEVQQRFSYDAARRRIIVWRVPDDNPFAQAARQRRMMPLMKIPFLAFADETIGDTDAVLLSIIRDIMNDAAVKSGASRG